MTSNLVENKAETELSILVNRFGSYNQDLRNITSTLVSSGHKLKDTMGPEKESEAVRCNNPGVLGVLEDMLDRYKEQIEMLGKLSDKLNSLI